MSFCDPQVEGIRRTAISFEVPFCCKSFMSTNKRLHTYIKACIRMVLPVKKYYFQNRWLCVLRHNPDSPKVLRNAMIIDLAQYSK